MMTEICKLFRLLCELQPKQFGDRVYVHVWVVLLYKWHQGLIVVTMFSQRRHQVLALALLISLIVLVVSSPMSSLENS